MTNPSSDYRFGLKVDWLYHETTIRAEPSPVLAAVAPRLALAHAQRRAEEQVVRDTRALVRGARYA